MSILLLQSPAILTRVRQSVSPALSHHKKSPPCGRPRPSLLPGYARPDMLHWRAPTRRPLRAIMAGALCIRFWRAIQWVIIRFLLSSQRAYLSILQSTRSIRNSSEAPLPSHRRPCRCAPVSLDHVPIVSAECHVIVKSASAQTSNPTTLSGRTASSSHGAILRAPRPCQNAVMSKYDENQDRDGRTWDHLGPGTCYSVSS